LLPHQLALNEGLPLVGGQIVPDLQAFADLILPLRGEAAKTLIIGEESLLLRGRHVLQALNPYGRQIEHLAGGRMGPLGQGHRGTRCRGRRWPAGAA